MEGVEQWGERGQWREWSNGESGVVRKRNRRKYEGKEGSRR